MHGTPTQLTLSCNGISPIDPLNIKDLILKKDNFPCSAGFVFRRKKEHVRSTTYLKARSRGGIGLFCRVIFQT
jgi:hypothetical protein